MLSANTDLPILVRSRYANNVSAVDLTKPFDGHVDIPRLREGQVGGFFWSTYVDCVSEDETGKDYLYATWRVRYVCCNLPRLYSHQFLKCGQQ